MRGLRSRATATMPVRACARSLDLQDIIAFYEARRGPLHGFRFRDPFDMKSCAAGATPAATDQALGTGDGATARFALVKRYGSGGDAYLRPIRKPVAGTLKVAVAGIEKTDADAFQFRRRDRRNRLRAGLDPGRRPGGDGGIRIRCAGALRRRAHRGQHLAPSRPAASRPSRWWRCCCDRLSRRLWPAISRARRRACATAGG